MPKKRDHEASGSPAHEREHLDRALAAFGKVGRQLGVIQ